MAPIGTVTAWLGGNTIPIPNGWQKCDGSPIFDGPMNGTNTPNLNGEELFLRGGSVSNSWTVQQDQIKDHHHAVIDPGHTHTDGGHKHTDAGHDHWYKSIYYDYEWNFVDIYDAKDTSFTNWFGFSDTYGGHADIQTGHSSISTDESKITVNGVSDGSAGTETRPRNMVVEWIIKIK